ncbi:hypothetical protein ACTXQV_80600, partial [Klebsiella pneumoniae]
IPVRITVNDGQNNSERLRPGMSVQVPQLFFKPNQEF